MSLRSNRAFSLIELLTVIAIMGLLAFFAIPAVTSIGQAHGVTDAVDQITSAVELARSEAISRQTYVWVSLQPQTTSGNLDLWIGMVYSKDASTDTSPANLQPLRQPFLIHRVGLVNATALNVGTSLTGVTDLASYAGGVTFQIGQVNFNSGRTITFTPLGEVMEKPAPNSTDGFDPRLSIGFRSTHGTTLMPNNDVAVVVDGSVGVPTVYRP